MQFDEWLSKVFHLTRWNPFNQAPKWSRQQSSKFVFFIKSLLILSKILLFFQKGDIILGRKQCEIKIKTRIRRRNRRNTRHSTQRDYWMKKRKRIQIIFKTKNIMIWWYQRSALHWAVITLFPDFLQEKKSNLKKKVKKTGIRSNSLYINQENRKPSELKLISHILYLLSVIIDEGCIRNKHFLLDFFSSCLLKTKSCTLLWKTEYHVSQQTSTSEYSFQKKSPALRLICERHPKNEFSSAVANTGYDVNTCKKKENHMLHRWETSK